MGRTKVSRVRLWERRFEAALLMRVPLIKDASGTEAIEMKNMNQGSGVGCADRQGGDRSKMPNVGERLSVHRRSSGGGGLGDWEGGGLGDRLT
ncbi:MAG: hypothetical protein HY785_18215 [Oscillatoriophycideae cyanobacterium NC_groundwater_1537_Pr4_S-0.65um_50_18]|nr:hypothetical protein [Oscillatoriophycideae cyanobacterium NC_groundwater_1537_Pr4_S-0.65um_50_18]